ncbi:MAG: M56 family metallopeptidase [Paramuribaculum sp.]|nr:M56 family metallopeptidase [Paramuribaculum sp.]
MGLLFAYSLYSGIILLSLYLAYKWVLANERLHHFNRMALWSIYAVSLLWLPFTALARHIGVAADLTSTIDGTTAEVADNVLRIDTVAHSSASMGRADIILWIYAAGLLITAVTTAIGLLQLARITARGTKINVDETGRYKIVVIDDDSIQPFSWHRYIVLSRSDMESAGDIIITHELAHLNHCHWLDLLISRMVAVTMWYNPAAWLMCRELSIVHEYQADEAVLNSGVTMRDYQILLIKKAVGNRFQSLANSLNHSKLKKRITMMYNQKKSARRLMRGIVLVPALAAAIAAVNIPAVASAISDASEAYMLRAVPAGSVSDKVNQNATPEQIPAGQKADKKVDDATNERPQYPGGDAELMHFIAQNVNYPAEAVEKKIEGTVIVQFGINEQGKVTNPKVMRSIDPALDAEALRVVAQIPAFIPAKQNGKPVSSDFVLPIRFKLSKPAPADSKKTAAGKSN